MSALLILAVVISTILISIPYSIIPLAKIHARLQVRLEEMRRLAAVQNLTENLPR